MSERANPRAGAAISSPGELTAFSERYCRTNKLNQLYLGKTSYNFGTSSNIIINSNFLIDTIDELSLQKLRTF
ncbi:MAG: hypothetical protein E3J23_06545 [Candidatus Stahlbacteria bacterium]|nr:MAG: hypothetical protein E3J23_06545 [Candidatus Stahlbacteria bacterium]